MARDPNQVAQDWAAGLTAKTSKMTEGIRNVSVAPGQLAARQKNAYLAGIQGSVDKWATNVGNVSLSEWQDKAINVGIPRVASGASAAVPRMAQVMAQLLPHIDRVKASLPPRGTYDQNKARANAMMDGMHGFKMSGSR
jgi:hypothetical protein